MERGDRPVVATYVVEAPLQPGVTALAGSALRHALVRRARAGEPVRLVTGRGEVARGAIASATRSAVSVDIEAVERVAPPPPLEILVPVADRDRMLWAAEKCVEHQVTAWRPVRYRRSQSVAGRGEGAPFARKVAARMRSALEQCGGAWLPEVLPEYDVEAALRAVPGGGWRYLLDGSGVAIAGLPLDGPGALAVGPEGGFEPAEREAAFAAGWRAASLGGTTLRFETAIVSGAAVVRAVQFTKRSV